MQCLDDSDDSIRLRALDLLYGMVSKKNLMEIVKKLMAHMEKAEGTTYRSAKTNHPVRLCEIHSTSIWQTFIFGDWSWSRYLRID